MSVFKFPKAVCHDLDSLIAEFWWGSVGDHRKTHWVSKHTLGLSKKDEGLGFRNFGDFNDALLAKQCWRLIHNPDSLWAKVLKARYFPNCSFLDAKKGSRASWGWNSLLVGRDILLQGAHWQIMNGRSVHVWVDRWLPSLPLGHPMPGRVSVTRDTRVASLLTSSPRLWNIDFLQPFLSVDERSAILATPLGDDLLPDRLVWPHTGTEMYSVWSGYLWARSSRQQEMPSRASSSSTPTSQIWTLIWSLKTPPKVRHFMWRLAHGALATFEKMYVRKLASTLLCPICQKQVESLEHLFLMCSWVEPIWFGGMLNLRIDRSSISSWLNWFLSVASRRYGSKEERWEILSYIAVSCWHIWTARCKFLFQQVNLNPYQVLMAIRTARGKFFEAKGASAIMSSDALPMIGQEVRWSPPPLHFFKVNVDASWNSSSLSGFVGVVIRAEGGTFVAARRESISASSVASAEAFALVKSCELAAELGLGCIIVESDYKNSISALSSSLVTGRWEAFPTLAVAKRFGESFQDCRWTWVPRSANQAADLLASRTCTEMCNFCWVNRPPSSLVHVLNKDGLPCPH
ncbi:hypothetical protein ACFX15_042380 [Malus domestica]